MTGLKLKCRNWFTVVILAHPRTLQITTEQHRPGDRRGTKDFDGCLVAQPPPAAAYWAQRNMSAGVSR